MSERPTTSNADEWQLWLLEGPLAGPGAVNAAYISVQIVEAIEEHQKALAREVYGLREETEAEYEAAAKRDDIMGAFARGRIAEAKTIARAINAIMPYSRDTGALGNGGRQRLAGRIYPQAVSAAELLGALNEWLRAHSAMVHFLLGEAPAGEHNEAQWDAQRRVIHKRQADAIERAIAVVEAAKKHGTRDANSWSPGVAKAMAKFDAGLKARYVAEHGLPWHIAPWGDGSKPPYVNICSDSQGAVIAADLDRETANFIVNWANSHVERPE